jgi:hypothetical protein
VGRGEVGGTRGERFVFESKVTNVLRSFLVMLFSCCVVRCWLVFVSCHTSFIMIEMNVMSSDLNHSILDKFSRSGERTSGARFFAVHLASFGRHSYGAHVDCWLVG